MTRLEEAIRHSMSRKSGILFSRNRCANSVTSQGSLDEVQGYVWLLADQSIDRSVGDNVFVPKLADAKPLIGSGRRGILSAYERGSRFGAKVGCGMPVSLLGGFSNE
jgi:hypothetical protein